MELTSKPKNLDEKEFITRIQNGYSLRVAYRYSKDKTNYLLSYELARKKNGNYNYYLIIQEGIEDADFGWGFCTEREEEIKFITIEKALNYLKEREKFMISDWHYSKIKSH